MSLFSKKRSYTGESAPKVDTKKAIDYDKSFSESFMDEWHFQTYTGNSYSKTDNLHDEYEKEIESIEKQTGKKLDNPHNSAFEDFFIEDIAWGAWDTLARNPFSTEAGYFERRGKERLEKRLKKYNKELNKLKEEFPNLQYRDEKTINEDIQKQALAYYTKANDGRNANGWGSFLGAAAGSLIDPINVFATLISGGGSAAKQGVVKALGKTAAREFVNNAAVEAVIQPSVYKYKQELGIPYSKEEAILNVAAAGVGGAALGTAGKAVHLTSKEVLAKYKKAVAQGVEFDGSVKADADFLEQQVAFDDWIDKTNPFGDDAEARLLHEHFVEKEMRRLTDETGQLSKAYDEVLNNPVGEVDDPLIAIQPEDMERVWIERGEMKPYNGKSKYGYGLVKFIFHHGEKSNEKNKLSKNDVVNFPKVIRDVYPVPEESSDWSRLWRVENEKGQRVVYIDRHFDEDGTRHIVTMYIEDRADKIDRPLSKKKNVAGKLSAHTKDTTQETYYRTNESSAYASAPKSRFPDGGNVYNIISPDELKVKDFSGYDVNAFQKELESLSDLTPEQKKLNAEIVEKIKQEDGWDDQILDCILEFSKK